MGSSLCKSFCPCPLLNLEAKKLHHFQLHFVSTETELKITIYILSFLCVLYYKLTDLVTTAVSHDVSSVKDQDFKW